MPEYNEPHIWTGRAHQPQPGRFVDTRIDAHPAVAEFGGLEAHVTVTENAGGEYLGWVDAGCEDDPPVMIQHEKIFEISFPYGSAAEVRAGRGSIVRLSVTAAEV
ncbi:hypothetical protein ACT17_22760 [Mycolicibacterium conceptionense]|uniref:Uncharacterized protein n=2 Tax=Mycolicibacterium conceptionense TaxID=451644 RepID=A0A0J8U325_9MYCO|nr:hypothetical protein ACT17_22760 [Mycolicibacterium conceptionense]